MRDLSHTNTQHQPKFFTNFRINVILLGAVIALGLVYIFSVNSIAASNFQIKKLSNQLADLEEQHKNLELQNSTLQSVTAIQQETSHLNFVPTTSMMYLKDDSFALR